MNSKLRIAVYAICKDEEQFVKRFMAPLGEADLVVVADTGSSDNTVQMLRDEGAIVYQIKMSPWRFDTPRNVSLSFVPADIDVCVCIDLDEVLTPGWREAIEKVWTKETTQLRYQYVWNTLPDGRPGTTFWYEKIHARNGYRWVKPVHEILQYYGDKPQHQTYCNDFMLFHYPDSSKSRSNYLPLLEMGCHDEPEDDRNSHYLGREYMYYKMWDQSIAELTRHLALPSAKWDSERCASMRFISRCYLAKNDFKTAEIWGLKACAEAPADREPWLDLGRVYYQSSFWPGLYHAMKKLLSIVEKTKSYICEPDAWGGYPYDYAALAAYNMGLFEEAVSMCEKAIELEPSDDRLKNNILFMKNKIQ